jgi:hypothetical protein
MKQEWENPSRGWPSGKPVWSLVAIVMSVVVFGAAAWWRYEYRWTALQQAYVKTYLKTQVSLVSSRSHRLIQRVDGKKIRLAVNADLADPAVVEGRAKLAWSAPTRMDNAKVRGWLAGEIYGGYSPLAKLAAEAQWPGAFALLVGLVWAFPKDRERARIRREGRRLRGPELVSAREFNTRNRSDGIGFFGEERSWWSRVFRKKRLPRGVSIPREHEARHVLIMGDSGTGKGALIRQLLIQIAGRGETAIVYDPALEYVPRFYCPERGDLILNPMDERMPYWSPGDEVSHEAEAATIAASLFPDHHQENRFFVDSPRRVFAHLLTFRPSPQELTYWLRHEEEIDKRVKGTELAVMVSPGATQQRAGVLSSLNMVADALKLLPRREERKTTWSATAWAKERKGWIFLTSQPSYRERLRPLLSLWLDLLVLRLMNEGAGGAKTWFVLDELATLQKLPQLHTAVTENRKSGNPVVLSFQGRSQLEARYGHEAEAMLSQPATKVFLGTSEPHGAKWISDTIGEVEIERLGESRSHGEFPQRRKTQGHQLERQVEPLILPSQIAGLEKLHGYLKSGNLVVRLGIHYFDLPCVQPDFIPRRMPPEETPPVPAAPEGELVFFR